MQVFKRPTRVLDLKTSDAAQTGIGTAYVDITGLTITFTVGDRPVQVEAYLPWITPSAAMTVVAAIRDDANADKEVSGEQVAGAHIVHMRVIEIITTPGTYTRKVSLARSGGSGTIANNAGFDTTTSVLKAEVL